VSCGAPRGLTIAGRRLGIHEWGAPGAPPALLLHSLAAHAHWWDWVAPRLADRRHVVALDLRGHGASAWAVPPAYAFDDYAADVAGVLEALGWTSALLVGHSLGGYVAARVAATRPERVAAVVLADVLTGWSADLDRGAREQAARPRRAVPSRAEAGARFRLAPPATGAPAERLRHLGETGVVERRPGAWEPAFDPQVFLHPPPDPWGFLPDIRRPALVVRGSGSAIMDAAAALRMTAAIPGAALAEIEGFHHLILDDPDGFAEVVRRWADRRAG
jgi:pimeloyl-ACP methyl ester carboxylesterase